MLMFIVDITYRTYFIVKALQNWSQCFVMCGSNAFNQLNPEYGELMTANFIHLPHPLSHDLELFQFNCNGNQSAVVVGAEIATSSQHCSAKDNEENDLKRNYQYQLYLWGSGKSNNQMRTPVPLPGKLSIAQLSCGQTHCGFVTERGAVFTWGSGEHGMLGHGTKSAVPEPRRVDSLKQLVCTAISCGAFHTAFIACAKEDVSYIRLPHREHHGGSLGVGAPGARLISAEESAAGGSLYMCGLGKAGQLGLGTDKIPTSGANTGCCPRPTLVPFFEAEGARVIKVSCGFHHTLAIAVPKQATRIFSPSVYSFGYGEHGRLGLGNEEQVSTPQQVPFPAPFHPTQVSAGEQHSIASGHDGCYSWGSNDMGQLGVNNPSQLEFATTPQKVPLPEGMAVRKIVAGGRHSGAITHCGNVLTWGWGEEGQLGHGTEKSSYLPRPCKLPKIYDRVGVPMDITLGGTHSVVVLHNPLYVAPVVEVATAEPAVVKAPTPSPEEPVPEPEPEPILPAVVEEEPPAVLDTSMEMPEIATLPPVEHKPPMISSDEDCFPPLVEENEAEDVDTVSTPAPPPPIRGLKDILQQREERK